MRQGELLPIFWIHRVPIEVRRCSRAARISLGVDPADLARKATFGTRSRFGPSPQGFREVFLQTLRRRWACEALAVDGTPGEHARSKAMSHARMRRRILSRDRADRAQMDELNAAEEQSTGTTMRRWASRRATAARATTGADPSGPGAASAGERGEARSEAPEELRGPRSEHDEDRGILAVLLQRAADE